MMMTHLRHEPDYWVSHIYATQAWTTLVALLGLCLSARFLGPTQIKPIYIACAFWMTVCGALISTLLAGAAIFVILPAFPAFLAIVFQRRWPKLSSGLWAFTLLIILLLWAPMFAAIGHALEYGIAPAIVTLLTLVLLPLLPYLTGKISRKFILGLSTLTAIPFLAACLLPAYSKANPTPLNFIHYARSDKNEAGIYSQVDKLSLINSSNLIAKFNTPEPLFPRSQRLYVSQRAPRPQRRFPNLSQLSTHPLQNGSKLSFELHTYGADRVDIYIPKSAKLFALSYDRHSLRFDASRTPVNTTEPEGDYVLWRCNGMGCDGAKIDLSLGTHVPNEWII